MEVVGAAARRLYSIAQQIACNLMQIGFGAFKEADISASQLGESLKNIMSQIMGFLANRLAILEKAEDPVKLCPIDSFDFMRANGFRAMLPRTQRLSRVNFWQESGFHLTAIHLADPPTWNYEFELQHIVEYTPWLNTLQDAFFLRMDIRDIVATNVRALRSAAGLSQEELAHRAQIDRTYVSSIERKRYAASVDVIAKLASVFGVEPFTLLRPFENE